MLAKLYIAYLDESIDWIEFKKYGEVIDRFLPGDASVLIRADNDFLPADSGTIDSILRLLSMGVVSQNVGLEVTDDGNGNVALASAEGYKFTTFGIKLTPSSAPGRSAASARAGSTASPRMPSSSI